MSVKNLVYKVPGISLDINRLKESYKEIIKKKKFEIGRAHV